MWKRKRSGRVLIAFEFKINYTMCIEHLCDQQGLRGYEAYKPCIIPVYILALWDFAWDKKIRP